MTPVTEMRLRVRYAETDQMGVVYYANYLVWMEVGRVDLCQATGFNYRDIERDDGIYFAVAEATAATGRRRTSTTRSSSKHGSSSPTRAW